MEKIVETAHFCLVFIIFCPPVTMKTSLTRSDALDDQEGSGGETLPPEPWIWLSLRHSRMQLCRCATCECAPDGKRERCPLMSREDGEGA